MPMRLPEFEMLFGVANLANDDEGAEVMMDPEYGCAPLRSDCSFNALRFLATFCSLHSYPASRTGFYRRLDTASS